MNIVVSFFLFQSESCNFSPKIKLLARCIFLENKIIIIQWNFPCQQKLLWTCWVIAHERLWPWPGLQNNPCWGPCGLSVVTCGLVTICFWTNILVWTSFHNWLLQQFLLENVLLVYMPVLGIQHLHGNCLFLLWHCCESGAAYIICCCFQLASSELTLFVAIPVDAYLSVAATNYGYNTEQVWK